MLALVEVEGIRRIKATSSFPKRDGEFGSAESRVLD
ncbi:hypothetical protein ACVWZ6_001449 [Bradyrhizobium sp. GM6.1]